MPNKRVSEVYPPDTLWPDIDRREKKDLVGAGVVTLMDAKQRTKKGRPFYVCLCVDADGEQFTSVLGGKVIYEKVEAIVTDRNMPIDFEVIRVDTPTGDYDYYYDIT